MPRLSLPLAALTMTMLGCSGGAPEPVARGEVEIEVVDRLGNRSSTVVPIGVTQEGA